MHEDCSKFSLNNLPLRGQALAAWLILFHSSDSHGVIHISRQELASFLGIRHPKNVRKLVRELEETGMILSLPGNGRGHVSTIIITYQRSYEDLMAVLLHHLDLSEMAAQNLLNRVRTQVSIHSNDSIAAAPTDGRIQEDEEQRSDTPEKSALKGTAPKGPLPKGPLPAPPFGDKGPAHKGPLSKPPLPEGPLPTNFSANLQKGTAPKGPLLKGPLPAPPFGDKGPAHKGPLSKPPLSEGPFASPSQNSATSDRARVRGHARTRVFAAANNKYSHEDKKQQQTTRVSRDPARTREAWNNDAKSYSLRDAFQLAGIKAPTNQRIPGAWKNVRGKKLTPEDVLAWHFQRESENRGRTPERYLGIGAIIRYLEAGETADAIFYHQAREYLTQLTMDTEDDAPGLIATEILDLRQELKAYLPPISDTNLDALDAQQAKLLDLAYELHSQKVDAKTVADLHLFLTYTGHPIPPPQKIIPTLKSIAPEFQGWRERKIKAERLWQHIVQQTSIAVSGSAVDKAMRRAAPVDMDEALVIMAEPDIDIYFQRLWPHKAASILSGTDYPQDLTVQFIHFPTQKDRR